jgi:hypothetical protein
MADDRDYFKLLTGMDLATATRIPNIDETLDEQSLRIRSRYPLRLLGMGQEAVRIREEDRSHIHLIGSTQEGKSKFIEHLIRGDIKRGIGFCLLDPTAGGRTAYDVLKYCAYKKIEKVCLIDPYHRFQYNKVPGLTPFLYRAGGVPSDKLKETSVKDFQDTVRTFSSIKDPAETFRIERYLPAVLTALYDAKRPLSDAKYFTNRKYKDERDEILQTTDEDTAAQLDEAFKTQIAYNQFQSTINRMQHFYKGTLGLMFTPSKCINFMKMISEGWIILVNLDTGMGFDTLDSRLLGTFIINQIQIAIEWRFKKLLEKNPDATPKPYYLYIDEASEYANRKLAKTLALKQKTGLKVTLAHQYANQFEDKFVFDSVLANCKITAMFNVRMAKDRDLISNQFYGGKIVPEEASDANADLRKQYAVIKALKGSPKRVRIPDIKSPPITGEELAKYISSIYQKDWYHNAQELNEPTRETTTNPQSSKSGTAPNRRAGSKAGVPDSGNKGSKWKTVSQNLPVSPKHAGTDDGKKRD